MPVVRPPLNLTTALLAASVLGIGAGGVLWLADARDAADAAFALTAFIALVPLAWSTGVAALKRTAGVDVIALLAIVGALALGEYLAGAVIGFMLATGRALEEYAGNRAERELSSLLKRAPRSAHRLRDGALETIPVEAVVNGDILAVKEGDVLPVDGVVTRGPAVLDESALTGESRLVERDRGDRLRSGAANAGPSFEMQATGTAEESTYAGIIRMVREAQQSKAPLVRLADRYAAIFVPVTLVTAGVAWAISGDPVRALSVLVVATPCPLLLAAPVAIVSGVSRAARRGIVVKGGAAIETLGRAQALFLDKTGTITLGAPRVRRTLLAESHRDEAELLRLAASLDQLSSHVLASSLVRSARERGLALSLPSDVAERAGAGIGGIVDGHVVRLGSFAWVAEGANVAVESGRFQRRVMRHEGSVIFAAVDGQIAGAFLFDDPIRPDAPRVLRLVKRKGIAETVMLTGDHAAIAEAVGGAIGVDHVMSELAPEEKVAAVRASQRERVTVMVGDGINDAPALAAADIGVAMGARGATSSSEAADVVLVVDRLDRLLEAIEIARRARGIAIQSMVAGMALSFVAMGLATVGLLPPVLGALLQEGIDAAAILNALRALGGGGSRPQPALPPGVAEALRAEHRQLLPKVQRFGDLADVLQELPPEQLCPRLDEANATLAEVLAHERNDERQVYTGIVDRLGGEDPLAAMSRTHQEIFHLARTFERAYGALEGREPDAEDLIDLRRTLYALGAILRLNIAQEEELYLALDPESTESYATVG
ncbi:MAG: heavy metal translocating P-type ATPase [Dehalococcoidia bacterium]|jgi:heavy metal translocating P-type ATPase